MSYSDSDWDENFIVSPYQSESESESSDDGPIIVAQASFTIHVPRYIPDPRDRFPTFSIRDAPGWPIVHWDHATAFRRRLLSIYPILLHMGWPRAALVRIADFAV